MQWLLSPNRLVPERRLYLLARLLHLKLFLL
jgi:hypothetical protein